MLEEVGDVYAQQPLPYDGEYSGKMTLHRCGYEKYEDENGSGMNHHDLNFFLSGFDNALADDSERKKTDV